jgi:hypothetical protein
MALDFAPRGAKLALAMPHPPDPFMRRLKAERAIPSRRRAGPAGLTAGLLLAVASGATSVMGTEASAAPLFVAPFLSFDAAGFPASVAIGDLNGDGKPDLVTASHGANEVSVLLGNADGTFGPKSDFAAGDTPRGLAIADLNGDGKPDLVTANSGANTVSVLLGNGDGTFAPKTDFGSGGAPYSVAIGDLNGDGKPDLAVANMSANTVSVLPGNGNGTFAPKTDFGTGSEPRSVAIGDLNVDGKADLAVSTSQSSAVSVLLGSGNGTFEPKTDFGTGLDPNSVAIGDLNGDGKPDLAVASGSNTVSVLLNAGPGTTDVGPAPTTVPGTAELLAPRPNPSRGASEIRWVVPSACRLDLAIFDLAGRRVRLLLAGARSEPGQHGVSWDGRDDTGARVREGVYLVRLRVAGEDDTRKLFVLQ